MSIHPLFRWPGVLALACILTLSACSTVRKAVPDVPVGVYVPDVVQGNVVTREQRELLRPGMGRQQVRDLLGTPMAASVFHANRWDYAFSIARRGKAVQSYRLTVLFKDDVLASVEGDELPSENEFVGRIDTTQKPAKVPNLQATEAQLARFPVPQDATPSEAPAKRPLPTSYPPLETPSR